MPVERLIKQVSDSPEQSETRVEPDCAPGKGGLAIGGLSLLRGDTGRLAALLVLIALATRLIPAALVYGSDDVSSWIDVARAMLQHRNIREQGSKTICPLQ